VTAFGELELSRNSGPIAICSPILFEYTSVRHLQLYDLNHRLAVFEPSFGRVLLASALDPLCVSDFWC
jgi:hypothetical protein